MTVRFVRLDDEWIARSFDWGERLAAWYDTPEGRLSASRSRSGDRGTEKMPHRLAQGKIGEVAVAQHFGLSPGDAVRWDVGSGGDGGTDVRLPNGILADVKTTHMPHKLIWSRTVNDLYFKKHFDVLISVSLGLAPTNCWIEGYISKQEFFDRKQIADGRNSGLEPGTWFMDKRDLHDVNDLRSVDYDSHQDTEGYFTESYRAIKERMANGGPGWEPKP